MNKFIILISNSLPKNKLTTIYELELITSKEFNTSNFYGWTTIGKTIFRELVREA